MIAYASSRPPTKVSHQEETYIVVFSLISEASDLSRNRLALPERRDFFPAAKLQEGRLFRASERQI